MIKSFRHKGIERFFRQGDLREIGAKQGPRIRRGLDLIEQAASVEAFLTVDGGLAIRPVTWDRKAFARELSAARAAMPMGRSVPARTDNATFPATMRVDNDKNPFHVRQAKHEPAFFTNRMVGVGECVCHGITKHRGCFLEADFVLLEVLSSLYRIDFKFHTLLFHELCGAMEYSVSMK